MKKLLSSLLLLFTVSFASFGQIQTYDITIGNTLGLSQTSGDICTSPWNVEEAKQNSAGNMWGATWTSVGSGTPTSVSVEVSFTVADSVNQSMKPTTLNGTANNMVAPSTPINCATGPTLNWTLDPSTYVSGGSNTFLVNYATSGVVNKLNNLPYASNPYLRITVDYSPVVCIDPDIPTLSISDTKVCLGESATITTSGNLNDAAEWYLYSTSCGGTLEQQNATGTFVVSPTTTTDYFIRGEGNCVIPGACETINLQVDPIPSNIVTQNGITLTAQSTTALYQWLDCDNNFAPIVGATSQDFTPAMDGNYAVQVTEFGCPDTSACFNVTGVGIFENAFGVNFKSYPNPTDGTITIDLGEAPQNVSIAVRNVVGQLVYSQQNIQQQKVVLDLTGEAGFYLIEVQSEENQTAVFRILKE